MTIRDSLETHFVGPELEIRRWDISDWVQVTARLLILATYIVAQTIISISERALLLLVENPITGTVVAINRSIWKIVPVFGRYAGRLLPKIISHVKGKSIPLLGKISQLLQFSFQLHLVEMTLKNKRNVQIFITAESDNLDFFDEGEKLKTTLLLANHRSINDYMLINFLIQNCRQESFKDLSKRHLLKKFWQEEVLPIPKTDFIGWGQIANFPHLSLIRNIFMQDENAFVSPRKIQEHLKKNGNQVLTIFPEVNIMTTELAIVQRKLNQDYPFVARFYNVLYPRFRNFVSIVKCFAHINHVRRRQHGTFFDHAKLFFENGMDKLIFKATPHGKGGTEKEQANAAMIVGIPNSPDHTEMILSDESAQPAGDSSAGMPDVANNIAGSSPSSNLQINPNLYDLTIVYYRPRYTNGGHDHVNGCIRIHKGYQLEQVNPSLLEMLKPERAHLSGNANSTTSTLPPIVIMVHISKHEVAPLLPAKVRNLEKWLEAQWFEKDKLIDSIENGIKIK